MTLIVETGTGIANANSYISLVDATAYHSKYGNTDWAGTDADLEQALILGTRSVDLLYASRFLSFMKVNQVNGLQFPRMFFYDNNQQWVTDTTIPQCVKDAVCEIALMHILGTDIFPVPNNDGGVKVNRVKIGEIEIENQYSGNKGQVESYVSFNKIDLILQSVLKRKKNTISFVL